MKMTPKTRKSSKTKILNNNNNETKAVCIRTPFQCLLAKNNFSPETVDIVEKIYFEQRIPHDSCHARVTSSPTPPPYRLRERSRPVLGTVTCIHTTNGRQTIKRLLFENLWRMRKKIVSHDILHPFKFHVNLYYDSRAQLSWQASQHPAAPQRPRQRRDRIFFLCSAPFIYPLNYLYIYVRVQPWLQTTVYSVVKSPSLLPRTHYHPPTQSRL